MNRGTGRETTDHKP